jgi:hypothetical protein
MGYIQVSTEQTAIDMVSKLKTNGYRSYYMGLRIGKYEVRYWR